MLNMGLCIVQIDVVIVAVTFCVIRLWRDFLLLYQLFKPWLHQFELKTRHFFELQCSPFFLLG